MSRASQIIDHIREFASRNKKKTNSKTNLRQAIGNVIGLIGQQLLNHNIEIRNDVQQSLKANVDQARLEQALVILISNAKDSINSKTYPSGENGIVQFSSTTDKQSIILRIQDNGTGVHEKVRNKLFEPFVTTKMADKEYGTRVVYLSWNSDGL